MPKTIRFWRRRLPHWELEGVTYFITIRCAGKLPIPVAQRLRAVAEALSGIEPKSLEYTRLQKKYFALQDKELDTANDWTPFLSSPALRACRIAMAHSAEDGWPIQLGVVMPNHVHFIFHRLSGDIDLETAVERFKGRSARLSNQVLNRKGRLWHEDWFDHWIRDNAEMSRVLKYIRLNPVKAGLASDPSAYEGFFPSAQEKN